MAKTRSKFVCSNCSKQSPAYLGRCPNCGQFNTFQEVTEEVKKPAVQERRLMNVPRSTPQRLAEVSQDVSERYIVPMGELNRVLGGGLVPGSITLIGGEPGIGKCVTGDTRVLDPLSGAYLPITDWAKTLRPVLSINSTTLTASPDKTIAFHRQGLRPIVEVRTRLGKILRCTPTHPLLTADGWQPVSALTVGARIGAPRSLAYFGRREMSEVALYRAVDEALDDGVIPAQVFELTQPQLMAFLDLLCDGLPRALLPVKERARLSGFSALSVVSKQPVAADASVSGGQTRPYRSAVTVKERARLSGFSSGAAAHPHKISRGMRSRQADTQFFVTPFPQLAQDVQHLLLRLGIISQIYPKTEVADGEIYPVFALQSPQNDTHALTDNAVYWDDIISITPAGDAEVYDLSVATQHNFVANDLFIHNSTLLLQSSSMLANSIGTVLYVSGEESASQIKLRADRLNLTAHDLYLLTETKLEDIFEHVVRLNPTILVVDSIQTTYTETIEGSPGLVSQVRECASRLQGLAKSSAVSVFLVGHVTKDGAIAGPRVLEHIVDTVLYLEGDPFQAFRLLRSVKNRFGATSEVGVFEMQGVGMVEVTNPSEAFLAERVINAPGSAIAVTMEGTRPLLVEIQALTSPTPYGNPRRTPNGVDMNRLLLLSAVLTKRFGLRLAEQDIFVNVVGGMKISEPASDLAMAVAMASSYYDTPIPADMVLIGEVGLSGEVRAVSQLGARLNEAAKIGFKRAIVPKVRRPIEGLPKGLEIMHVRTVGDALKIAVPK